VTLEPQAPAEAAASISDFDADELRAATFVRRVEIRDSLDSTNTRAVELAREPGLLLPALVVARRQTAGRGRGENRWWSTDGALTFSMVLDPASHGIAVDHWPRLSLAAAIAVCDALRAETTNNGAGSGKNPRTPCSSLRATCSIKWPNDVMIDDRKVAGILLESPSGSSHTRDRLVLGIGVNVNNSAMLAPIAIREHVAALCDATGRIHRLHDVLVAVLHSISARMVELGNQDPKLTRDWRNRNYLLGRSVVVDASRSTIKGECVDIADDGALVIETREGPVPVFSGTVRIA
jgi:BirA family biotin operon repressor/biotin-[acetyl-CoA-carboxylase] ligase